MTVYWLPDGDPDGSQSNIGRASGHQSHEAEMVVHRDGEGLLGPL